MTFVICGSHEKNWIGYSFVDTHNDEEELENLASDDAFGGTVLTDPISTAMLDKGKLLLTDPREYWLLVYQLRIEHVLREWELIVGKFEPRIIAHVSYPTFS